MTRIWKWPLEITDRQAVTLPRNARILTAQMQGDVLCIWTECDPTGGGEARTFSVYGTGNPMPESPGLYIGTVQTHGGALVWHVYEIKERGDDQPNK